MKELPEGDRFVRGRSTENMILYDADDDNGRVLVNACDAPLSMLARYAAL